LIAIEEEEEKEKIIEVTNYAIQQPETKKKT
jgi:hypothetical protein